MVKRPKRRHRRSEEEWEDWGEKFGKRIERRGKEFGEEMRDLGEKFGGRVEHSGKEWENWWYATFGFISPLVGTVIGLIFLLFGIVILNWINFSVKSGFISAVTDFLFANLHWFFLASLFFGYSDYFSKRHRSIYWLVSPIVNSMGIFFVIWISVFLLTLINAYANNSVITLLTDFLHQNIWGIAAVFLVLGYVFVVTKKLIIGM